LGPGEAIPYTDKRKYLMDDVVAVIQVKKNLYSSDLRSGYANLQSVTKFDATRDRRTTLLRDAFQGTTRRPLPAHEELDSLPWETQLIYHALVTELVCPARIIFGYNGFKTLSALRQSFVTFLKDQLGSAPTRGFGLSSMPSLICCARHCLVKSNGMPFCAPLDDDGFWPALGSVTTNPVELLLEVVWTRLVYDKKLPATVFDDDSFLQPMLRFLDARPVRDGGKCGWLYRFVDELPDVVDSPTPAPAPWEPAFLDQTQFNVVNRLCHDGQVDVTEDGFAEFLTEQGYTVESLIASLNKAGLAARHGNRIVLLTRGCQCAILPDGRFAAAENIAGQFTRWTMAYLENRKSQQEPGRDRC
jgi:hypothetical protein